MRLLLIITALFLFLFNYPVSASDNNELTVAAAANVKFIMEELKNEFKEDSGIDIKTIIASSGELTAQIKNGAPFDVFMSADIGFPQNLFKDKFAIEKPRIYAWGTLVLWTLKDLELSKGFMVLLDKNIEKIAIAYPKNAPYGEEAVNVINYYKIYHQIKDKLVFGKSISQVNNYIVSKNADIGFTSKSTVLSPQMKDSGKWIEIDHKTYKPIAQGAVILKYGKENNYNNSKKFMAFLFSKKSKKIFQKYGYLLKN